MKIDGIASHFSPIQPIKPGAVGTQPGPQGGQSFGAVFSDVLKQVDQMQTQADEKINAITLGSSEVSTHDAMIALEQADIAFTLMSQVRNRIVRAYEEVMRTQV